jgi:hypothetical protein
VSSDNNDNRDGISISSTGGDVIGVGVSGSGNVIGKNIAVGSGTINVDESQIQKVSNEYANALKDFSKFINEQLAGLQVPEDKVKSINKDLTELGKEIEGVKPGEEDKVDYLKRLQVEGKTASLVQKILDVLPETAETASAFTPLAPFSKIIGKTVRSIVDAVSKK